MREFVIYELNEYFSTNMLPKTTCIKLLEKCIGAAQQGANVSNYAAWLRRESTLLVNALSRIQS